MLDFRARLVPLILRCSGSDFFVGIMDDALFIFVLDLDSIFGLRFEDFGWNPSFLVELGS
jgi:hypothetical protein